MCGNEYGKDADQGTFAEVWMQQNKGDCIHDPGIEYLSFVLILVKGGNRI